ncbi:RNA polymerase sigma-70 factor (ECF subfamily) [Scopulibacillus darangshiensis]|uniref:RNA polymerase sigma-70 factor (ECF subfamily) n=1 Tax=Scopulibacillus darangshiensis TaxID=442528 RepID=A0A4R2NZA3_9BACL|nr:sigma-70 family RNA polymerase sigma factor [Scopulibacillus darangshiensis]TCP27078.1 RNA polymerase sigma-70 factor (ECF subfamily) [Scopulibacillus darangshiensis]
MNLQTDVKLYFELRQHDQSALEAIYDRYEKLLYSFAYRMTQNTGLAEDVVQEVFMKLWHGKSEYDQTKGKFSSWLLTITRYTAIDHIRKLKQEDAFELDERDALQSEEPSVEDEITWKEEKETIRRSIHTLSKDQQEMIHLFYYKGYSQKQISESCDIPLGTVKGRIRLALKHLKKRLDDERGVRL